MHRTIALFLFVAPSLPGLAAEGTDAVARGLDWLGGNQADNGSWGKRHSYAVTGLACLAHLAAADEPFTGPRAPALLRGLRYLMAHQADGMFPAQGHTWIHGQGYATLALSEAYGRALLCGEKPDLDVGRLKRIVARAATAIARHQSKSGGWWYHPNDPNQHEGSTTVCAVQALVAAHNHGHEVERAVLDRGFEYLKRCQNRDGGFDYKEGPGTTSMKEGTAAGVATKTVGHEAISKERFPYYGHFYGCMGMRLYGEEMAAEKETAPYIAAVHETLRSWQDEKGAWPLKGWMIGNSGEDQSYSTAFATLLLSVRGARLSIFHRRPPTLPAPARLPATD
ncbi:MAG: prenyltransferase/squalene oxidase repeat-containing protein [Planctomycetota bacterium]|jgi:hypothetical protein